MDNIFIVIPAYQPDICLIQLVKELKHYDVLAVDDGSGFTYETIFSELRNQGVTVIGYADNRGKGYALKTAFQYYKQNLSDKEWIITADADGQHSITDISRIAKATENSGKDLILGIRKFKGYVPLRSRIGNIVSCVIFYLLTKKKISDTQSGLRAYRVSALDHFCKIDGNRYEYEMNCLLKTDEIGTIPIETIYQKNNKSSHFRAFSDSLKILKVLVTAHFEKTVLLDDE